MLSDWYFCCCVQSDADKTSHYLAVLETIDTSEAIPEITVLAYQQLHQTDIWMRIYALPKVLYAANNQQNMEEVVYQAVNEYMKQIVSFLPEEIEEQFSNLLAYAITGRDSSKCIELINECAKLTTKLPQRNSTPIPYLDLKTFLPETILLSVIYTQIQNSVDFGLALVTHLHDEQSESGIEVLLALASENLAGRLAWLHSTKIQFLIGKQKRNDFLKKINNMKGVSVLFEPDLLQLYALITFATPTQSTQPEFHIPSLFEETVLLNEYLKLYRETVNQNDTQTVSEVLERAGLRQPEQQVGERLSLIYWQGVITELGIKANPNLAANELTDYWKPLEGVPQNLPQLYIPGSNRKKGEVWRSIARELLRIKDLSGIYVPKPNDGGKALEDVPNYKWIFSSPWLSINESPNHPVRYPSASDDWGALLRLLNAVPLVIHLLRSMETNHSARPLLIAFTVHAFDVIEKQTERLPKKLYGFAMFCLRQLRMVGWGEIKSVSPIDFMTLLRNGRIFSSFESLFNDEEMMARLVLPEVIVCWIREALNVMDKQHLSGWIKHLPQIYDYYSQFKHSSANNVSTAALVTILVPQMEITDQVFDWRTAKTRKRNLLEWGCGHERLLLTRLLPVTEWLRPSWKETNLPFDTLVVRSVERLTAISADSHHAIDPDIVEGWREELISVLGNVNYSDDLDLLTRLRLLSFLENSFLDNDSKVLEVIAYTILEHGSLFEIVELFNRVYLVVEPSSARYELQISLIQAIYDQLQHFSLVAENQLMVEDPRSVFWRVRKASVLQEILAAIASIGQANFSLKKKMQAIREKVRRQAYKFGVRVAQTDVEIIGEKKIKVIKKNDNVAQLYDWMVEWAVYDPNQQIFSIGYLDIDIGPAINLFDFSYQELEQFCNNPPEDETPVLAVFVRSFNQNNQTYYVYNCGFSDYLQHEHQSFGVYPGQPVVIRIKYDHNIRGWTISNDWVEVLKPQFRSGDVSLDIVVKEDWNEKTRNFWVRNKDETLNVVSRLWDGDQSRHFRPFPSTERKVLAKIDAKGRWFPLDQNMTDLFLSDSWYTNENDQEKIIVLTYLNDDQNRLPLPPNAWRFAVQPGENYTLFEYDFVPETSDKLAKAVENQRDAHGLLITLRSTRIDGKVKLELASPDVGSLELTKRYPYLQTPFDERNIQWRELFHEDQLNKRAETDQVTSYLAKKQDDGNWYLLLEDEFVVPGHPEAIRVLWRKETFRREETSVEFTIDRWNTNDQRNATVIGTPVSTNRLMAPDGDWQRFLQRWLDTIFTGKNRAGSKHFVQLLQPISSVNDKGYIKCLTRENAVVDLPLETCTMTGIQQGDSIDIKNRTALIERVFFYTRTISLEDSPPSEVINSLNNSCLGIITEAPRDIRGQHCTIYWQLNDGSGGIRFVDKLQQVNLLGEKLFPGSIVEGLYRNGEWVLKVNKPTILVSALWTVKQEFEIQDEWYFLGNIEYKNEVRGLAQKHPGQLALLPEEIVGIEHLAFSQNKRFQGTNFGDITKARTKNLAPEQPVWNENRYSYRRANLSIGPYILTGKCLTSNPSKNVNIENVQMTLKLQGDNYVSLEREFFLTESKIGKQPSPTPHKFWDKPSQKNEDVKEDKQKVELEKLIAKNKEREKQFQDALNTKAVLNGVWDNNKISLSNIKIPVNSQGDLKDKQWSNVVPLAEGQGAYISMNQYAPAVQCVLFEPAEGGSACLASFRNVPDYSPEEYRKDLGAKFGELFPLRKKVLYYVHALAADDINPHTGKKYEERYHRFEWGYGFTLLVPESQLHYKGNPFHTADFVLYHADAITALTFHYEEVQNLIDQGKEESEIRCIIDIDDSRIRHSESRTLYEQYTKHNIIHILHLRYDKDQYLIDFVEGFDEKGLQIDGISEYKRINAILDEQSQVRLISQREKNADLPRQSLVVLGRLNNRLFEETYGKEGRNAIYFEYVKFTLKNSPHWSAVKNDERLFLLAGTILVFENDAGLKLKPLPSLRESDIGDDVNDLLLLRRSFSVRENLLKKILERDGRDALLNKVMLVQVRFHKHKKKVNTMLWGTQIPTRKGSVLSSAITAQNESVFAAVVQSSKDTLLLEIKPAVFVRIHRDRIEKNPGNLTRGAIVRLDNTGYDQVTKFSVTRAMFGHRRYLPELARPAVALPVNELINKNIFKQEINTSQFWKSRKWFTIGGLPDLMATPRDNYIPQKDSWSSPNATDFARLMESKHPKIVYVAPDKRDVEQLYTIVPKDNPPVGYLNYANTGFDISFISVHDNASSEQLTWQYLTFSDLPIRSVVKIMESESWVYHDTRTGTWDAESNEIFLQNLSRHTVKSGPLFFERSKKYLRLRYSIGSFTRYGYPVEELLYSLLDRSNKRNLNKTYTVAGISQDREGIWIELIPGRLVELPTALIFWEKQNNQQKSLAAFDWFTLNAGDRITLLAHKERNSGDIERIVLKEWHPGPRGSFGNRTFLPVQSMDNEQGAICLGIGEYSLKVPFQTSNQDWDMAVLYSDNRLDRWHAGYTLRQNDVVFLTLNREGKVEILGYPASTPVPDQSLSKSSTGFEKLFLKKGYGDREEFDPKGLEKILQLTGGLLPFTVEKRYLPETEAAKEIIFLSRKYQDELCIIPEGKMNLGWMLGMLDGDTAMLRCGAGLIQVRMEDVVSGIDANNFATVADALKKNHQMIWVRGQENNRITTGIEDEITKEIFVRPIEIIPDNSIENKLVGIVCQGIDSEKLYWLPASRFGWLVPSVSAVKKIFSMQVDGFKVRLMSRPRFTPFVSVINVREVQNEFKMLKTGSELLVKVLFSVSVGDTLPREYYVKSFSSNTVFILETHDQKPFTQNSLVPVEVIRRVSSMPPLEPFDKDSSVRLINPPAIIVVPVGKKPYYLDLPKWILTDTLSSNKIRKKFADYIEWRQASESLPETYRREDFQNIDDRQIERYLCFAYNQFVSEEYTANQLRCQIHIAEEWIRRFRTQPELDLAYAIMAILILDGHGFNKNNLHSLLGVHFKQAEEWREKWLVEASKMAQNLGQRALRSLHIEPVISLWLNPEKDLQSGSLWSRLNSLKQRLGTGSQSDALGIKDLQLIRQLWYAAELRPKDDIRVVANSLFVSMGEIADMRAIYKDAEITSELIFLAYTLPLSKARKVVPLNVEHVRLLRRILDKITFGHLDITLLDTFPKVMD